MDTIKKSIYTLTNEESKKLNALLALVESKPNWCYDIIIKGFRFMIIYRKLSFDYAFEATMLFSPG